MNTKNLKRLKAKLLELDDSQLDMRNYVSDCGTVRCVAGWAYLWFKSEYPFASGHLNFFEDFLEIRKNETNQLYWIYDSDWAFNFNTIEHAIKRIDYLLEHDNVPKDYIFDAEDYYRGRVLL